MLSYLSKFVLQMLPTISATVIGAYIVTTWINPKTPPEPAKVAGTQAQAGAKTGEPAAVISGDAQVKTAEAAETAKPAKSGTTGDSIRVIPIVKQSAAATEAAPATVVPVPEPAAAAAERKTVNELARAAIQRLRGSSEAAGTVEEQARRAPQPKVQQGRNAAEVPAQPAQVVTVAPPLPPPVSISSPRYPRDEGVDEAAAGQSDRLSPPADIPAGRPPLSLHASHRVAENPSFADDFLTATKSFFRAITPQPQ